MDMDDAERHKLMREALRRMEREIRNQQMDLIGRGLVYLDDGLPLGQLLQALGISRRTWERRVDQHRHRYDGMKVEDE
jgi:hypothetical protein